MGQLGSEGFFKMTSISLLVKLCILGVISVAGAPADPASDGSDGRAEPVSQVSPVSPDTQQTWSSPQGNGYQGPPSNYLKPWMPKNSFSGPVGFSAPSWRQQPRSWPAQSSYPASPYPMVKSEPTDSFMPSSSGAQPYQPYQPYNSGYNPGYGNSGFNPGYGNGNSGYNPGSPCGSSPCSPLYPTFGNGNSGYNPGNGCGTSSGCSAPLYPSNSGYNPGTDNTELVPDNNNDNSGSGYNPGVETGNSGFNPGTSGCGTSSMGCSSPLYPSNSGYNPGNGMGSSGYNPGYNSFTPLPGRKCFDVCRNRCSYPGGYGGGYYGGCRPVCRPRCNITPVCVGNQWQQGAGNSFSCGGSGWGYNNGYSSYSPSIQLPAQNGYAGVNTLPAASGGCGMSGGGCSDAAVSGSSSSLPSVSATAGPAPIVYADEDTAKTASEN